MDKKSVKLCRPNLQPRRLLGQGHFGQVWNVCDSSAHPPNCELAVKVVRIPKESKTKKGLERELKIAEAMGKLAISPRIYDTWKCDDNQVILMRQLLGKDVEHTDTLTTED